MKCTIPEISWHNRDPVLSVDIQPNKLSDNYRLASGGTDSHVLIWLVTVEKGGVVSLECAADLTRHTKPVNCVRFSPSGDFLASGDDDSCIIIWKMKTGSDPVEFPSGEEDPFKEQWISVKVLRGHLQDVYDLSWSSDSKNLISGSVDNTAILWEIPSGKNLGILAEHKGFVQGVAWDPCGQYVATIGSDRVCRVYSTASKRVVARFNKGLLPGADPESKPTHLFHDDTLKSFFRRLTFTPDGELLIIPSGIMEVAGKTPTNVTMVFARSCLNKPIAYLPSLGQYTVAVRCCPVMFTLRPMKSPPLFDLPYRVVIAVATQCSVVLYDTQHAAPFAFITKIHYTRLTDITWSSDGRVLVISSTDGYCSAITFEENELGTVYNDFNLNVRPMKAENTNESLSSSKKKHYSHSKKKSVAKNEDANMTVKKDYVSVKEHSQKLKLEEKEKPGVSLVMDITEDANMSLALDDDKEEKELVCKDNEEQKAVNVEGSTVETKIKDANVPSALIHKKEKSKNDQPEKHIIEEDIPMETEDFQLVYEATVADPVLEQKGSEEQINTTMIPLEQSKITDTSSEVIIPAQVSSVTNPDYTTESPGKNKGTQPETMTSPVSNVTNVTPGNSNKKTPRRVQLITLSSPKTKKKLLQ